MFKYKLFTLSMLLAVAYWTVEASIHTWIFEEASWVANLWPSSVNERWMRLFTVGLFMGFGVFAEFSHRSLSQAMDQRVVLESRLADALSHALSDFIPVCAHCKAIREGEQWLPLEKYVTQQTGARFSHGLCPRCLPIYESRIRT